MGQNLNFLLLFLWPRACVQQTQKIIKSVSPPANDTFLWLAEVDGQQTINWASYKGQSAYLNALTSPTFGYN